ncbi:MAG: fused MFS/spermidine synthase [Parcubacteria group bacterium]|nr:fused MFS/spermidine synthase [Parcubacteria group bacterium]
MIEARRTMSIYEYLQVSMSIKRFVLEFIVFVSGAVVMVLELVGSRILAPHVGTSLIVWTSLIGIILGSLSLGYFWGGRLADQNPRYKVLSFILLLSGVITGAVALLQSPILTLIDRTIRDLRMGSTVATLLLFAPPSVLLGMVSPYAVKLRLTNIGLAGSTAGNLYAISTVGSIVGTFLAGFVLISSLGSTKILWLLALTLVALALLALLLEGSSPKPLALLFFGIFTLPPLWGLYRSTHSRIIDVDTQYNRVIIAERQDFRTGRAIRTLTTGIDATQAAMYLDGSEDLVLEYERFFDLVEHFNPRFRGYCHPALDAGSSSCENASSMNNSWIPASAGMTEKGRALMVGGAAYSYPKYFLKTYPEAFMDVVEIDPGMTALARRYFNLTDDPRLTIYHEDGRTFLNRTEKRYDAILLDAFHSSNSIPYQLTTKEAVQRMYGMLNDGGVVFSNIIASLAGTTGKFLQAEYRTYLEVFPYVLIVPVQDPADAARIQNVMVIAIKSPAKPSLVSADPELNGYLSHLWPRRLPYMPILTDDFAPVDQYTIGLITELR